MRHAVVLSTVGQPVSGGHSLLSADRSSSVASLTPRLLPRSVSEIISCYQLSQVRTTVWGKYKLPPISSASWFFTQAVKSLIYHLLSLDPSDQVRRGSRCFSAAAFLLIKLMPASEVALTAVSGWLSFRWQTCKEALNINMVGCA